MSVIQIIGIKKFGLSLGVLVMLMSSCIKDNPKKLTKDLIKGGKWDISTFQVQEFDNPGGWQEVLVFDTLYMNPGYMEFKDDNGTYGPTYRTGNFKFLTDGAIPFDWDAYGAPTSDEIPVMYFIFSKPWNAFAQSSEYKALVEIWEDHKVQFKFDLGNTGENNHHVFYTFLLTY